MIIMMMIIIIIELDLQWSADWVIWATLRRLEYAAVP